MQSLFVQGQSGAISNNPHGLPRPSPHQSSRPPRWDIIFVSVVNTLWDNLVWTCLILVMLCEILDTYVLVCWILMFVFENVGNVVITSLIYGLCEIWDVYVIYVMIIWYMWCICDISFVCLEGIGKNKLKRCILVTLPSVTLGKKVLYRVSDHSTRQRRNMWAPVKLLCRVLLP
jgi:hypothetical protein